MESTNQQQQEQLIDGSKNYGRTIMDYYLKECKDSFAMLDQACTRDMTKTSMYDAARNFISHWFILNSHVRSNLNENCQDEIDRMHQFMREFTNNPNRDYTMLQKMGGRYFDLMREAGLNNFTQFITKSYITRICNRFVATQKRVATQN